MPDQVVDDETNPAWLAGYKPRWYLWKNGMNHTYTHEGADAIVRVVLWGGEVHPAWSGTETLQDPINHGDIDDDGRRSAGTRVAPIADTDGAEWQRRVYRISMKTGERLRIELGGRPTKNGSKTASWSNSGDVDSWRLGELLHGGFGVQAEGGDGIGMTSLVLSGRNYYNSGDRYGRTPSGGFLPDEDFGDDPWPGAEFKLTNPRTSRTVDWPGCAGAGATRVFLKTLAHPEQLIIVEPGEGGSTIRPYSIRPKPETWASGTYHAEEYNGRYNTHQWSGHEGAVWFEENGIPFNDFYNEFGGQTPDEWGIDNRPCPTCEALFPPLSHTFYVFGWDDEYRGRLANVFYHRQFDAPSYGNWINAPERNNSVADGGSLPPRPAATVAPREPYDATPMGSMGFVSYFPGITVGWDADTKFGGRGGEWHGADGTLSAYGPHLGGGGGWGGGAAGNCDRALRHSGFSLVTVVSDFVANNAMFQRGGQAGGRWWNSARVQHVADADLQNPEPSWRDEDDNTPDILWPTQVDGHGMYKYGPRPYQSQPYKFGFGAAWICPERASEAIGWSVGHIAANVIIEAFSDFDSP